MWKWKLIFWFAKVISRTKAKRIKWLAKLRNRVIREIDTLQDSWTRIESSPKVITYQPTAAMQTKSRIAVVMQGPINDVDDFTFETLKHYTTSFPGADLILSTWEGADQLLLRKIEQLGVHVVISDLPEERGPYNVNCQIVSTQRGMRKAQELGVRYALKTRADNRFSAANIPDFLVGLLETFPVSRDLPQTGRILALDYGTRVYVPHFLSDIMLFGNIEDILSYWSLPLQSPDHDGGHLKIFRDINESSTPEIYLCKSYLKRIGYPIEQSAESWWRTLADLFLVVDRSSLGFFWPKYDYMENHRRDEPDPVFNIGDVRKNPAMFSFRDWVNVAVFDKRCGSDLQALAISQLKSAV